MRAQLSSMCRVAALSVLLGLVAALACVGAVFAAGNPAYMRIAHAVANMTDVDVYLDGTGAPRLSNFMFGGVTDYAPVAAGTHQIEVTAAGKPLASAFISTTVTLDAGGYYTLAAVGDSTKTAPLAVFSDDESIMTGKAKVRLYHLSTDVGLAEVSTGGHVLIQSIGFEQASEYLAINPGTYKLDLTVLHGGATVSQTVTAGMDKVTSIFAVGRLAPAQDDAALKFVTVAANALPTAMPATGFAPERAAAARAAASMPAALPWAGGALVLLLILAGATTVAKRHVDR
jgi:hypothetical protein